MFLEVSVAQPVKETLEIPQSLQSATYSSVCSVNHLYFVKCNNLNAERRSKHLTRAFVISYLEPPGTTGEFVEGLQQIECWVPKRKIVLISISKYSIHSFNTVPEAHKHLTPD